MHTRSTPILVWNSLSPSSIHSVETFYPVQNPQDQRVSKLIDYAIKLEKAMFEIASSREQYYQLLAEKIYSIRRELEERRKMKLEKDRRRTIVDGLDSAIPNRGDVVPLNLWRKHDVK